mmetsp:Transcript_34832/g.68323  ORF Transcript_34832/g.68323 Transcript_34832/m.68323 type:complete len:213 (-) Transcript_34832:46-684(-)|eukprot:CAMPEP_0173377214 /NCGR_PEP_ID=MMETSP1356-20130122/419_1 /TAXON_ID=77927 ORGANISM="Hemiselmis virescens, Strain PCC157" /NCGR_SAMPLE_ID=MMETSP1356 /ASSEMBLY_ACC=CAM_ASM_000847 /LENGTH=212 /DNA_ID=CAMNT_0014329861 /DNA_START=45 /DNA_END=683 /DNA_ORIENTATION=-
MGAKETDKRGIPTKGPYPPGVKSIPMFYGAITGISLVVGQAFAHGVYTFAGTSAFDAKLTTLAAQGLGWMYLGMGAFKACSMGVAVILGTWRNESKVGNPNQHVYKTFGSSDSTPYVLMEEEGVIGKFNRAQRAHMVMVEGLPLLLANFLLAAFVFPLPAFLCAVVFSVTKVQSAAGYVKDTDSRMSIGNIFAGAFIEGLTLYAGWRALMRQ